MAGKPLAIPTTKQLAKLEKEKKIMYGLTTIMGLIKCEGHTRGLAAVAIAALISLWAFPMQARAQSASTNDDGGLQLEMSKSLRTGLNVSAGQTVRILIYAADCSTGSLSRPSGEPGALVGAGVGAEMHVRALSGLTGALLWSRELTSLTAGLHTIDINRDELTEAGEPETGRLELWIEVVILPRAAGSGQMDEVIIVGVYNTSSRIY